MGKRKQRRIVFRIKHSSGKESVIRSWEFFAHVAAGNLIQTPEQKQADFALAYVHPGLICYYNLLETLVFEYARSIEIQAIETILCNDFRFTPDAAAEAARSLMAERELARELARYTSDNVWERLYLKHMLRCGSIPKIELDMRMRDGLPVVEGESILSNDRKSSYNFKLYR